MLEVHCCHCENLRDEFASSKVYNWLTFLEYSEIFEIELLIPECIASAGSSECRVCIHCNSHPTKWSIVKNVFLIVLVISGTKDEVFDRFAKQFHRFYCNCLIFSVAW